SPRDVAFRAAYHDLDARMKALAKAESDVYFPNPEPSGRVDYIFVCMEPSLGGGWAADPSKAKAAMEAGFRNFVNSFEDFLLHFSIRRYLCNPGERYHVTDWSKGAMTTRAASVDRGQRYTRWYGLLLEELELVAKPEARLFAVGSEVARNLTKNAFPRQF